MNNDSFLSKLPILISVFGALVLILSIAYDYGYFMVFGVGFSEIPTTLSDHLRSSLTWIPNTLLVAFGVVALELFNRRVEQGMTEEEIIQTSPTPKFTAWFRDSPKYPIIALAVFAPFSFIFNIDLPLQAWQFSLIIIWFIFHNFLFSHERVLERTSKEFYLFSRWVPAILIFVVFSGAVAANNIKEGGGQKFVFELEKDKFEGALVRAFEKYYLIWGESKNIKLISSGKVISLYPAYIEIESNKKIQPTGKSGG
ncbi:hypothetical protein WKI13_09145 [Teredinibacter turnerae]|uniref:hypothetical protein n=1 Tax=Teredinibacter turnerae TaxID=2426 RepID=UPI00039A6C9D|nr:hypothetical protein [Teredinibacter turnerae]